MPLNTELIIKETFQSDEHVTRWVLPPFEGSLLQPFCFLYYIHTWTPLPCHYHQSHILCLYQPPLSIHPREPCNFPPQMILFHSHPLQQPWLSVISFDSHF